MIGKNFTPGIVSAKEALKVWRWTSAAGVTAGVTVRYGGGIVRVVTVRAATAGRGVKGEL